MHNIAWGTYNAMEKNALLFQECKFPAFSFFAEILDYLLTMTYNLFLKKVF